MSDEHDTEPSPPPDDDECVRCGRPQSEHGPAGEFVCGDGLNFFSSRRRHEAIENSDAVHAVPSGGESRPLGVAPSPGDSGRFSYHVNETGEVVTGPFNPPRPWHDYGLDTGPRLRVKRVLEGRELDAEMARLANAPPQVTDRDEEREIHRQSEQAFAEKDDRKLGKIYEDLLDEMHSPNLGERKASDAWFERAWNELESALTAELRELSRQERRYDWGFRVTKEGLTLRCVPRAGGETLECRVDKKALKVRVQQAAHDAKESAGILVRRANDEIRQARARIVMGGPGAVPFEADAQS